MEDTLLTGLTLCSSHVQMAATVLDHTVQTEEEAENVISQLKRTNISCDWAFALMFACVGRGHYHYNSENAETKAFRKEAVHSLRCIPAHRGERWPGSIFVHGPRSTGGDNLAATFSPELVDLTIYVIDVAAGDKIPRKGGPGITKSDLLVINKIDLAPYVGADLEIMKKDAKTMRGDRPFVLTNLKIKSGLKQVLEFIQRYLV